MSLKGNPKGKYVSTIDWNNPEGIKICDISGFPFPKSHMVKQMEWRGFALQWTGFLVGKAFEDKPNEALKSIVLKPDPVPLKNPRFPQEPGFYVVPPEPISEQQRFDNLKNLHWPTH